MIAKYRPKAPIVAVTANEHVLRRLALVWGVYPQLGQKSETTDDMLENAVTESLNSGFVSHGDLVVITAWCSSRTGRNNQSDENPSCWGYTRKRPRNWA